MQKDKLNNGTGILFDVIIYTIGIFITRFNTLTYYFFDDTNQERESVMIFSITTYSVVENMKLHQKNF